MFGWLDDNLGYLLYVGFCLVAVGGLDLWLRFRNPGAKLPRPVWWLAPAVLVAGWYFANSAGEEQRQNVRRSLESAAQGYAEEFSRLGHAQLSLSTRTNDPAYLALIEAEKRGKRANPIVAGIRTYRRDSARVRLIVAAENDYDRNQKLEGPREQRVPLGKEYAAGPALVRTLDNGVAAFSDYPLRDEWGTWVSAYAPLRDATNRVEAAVGVDYPQGDWQAAFTTAQTRVEGLLGIPLLLLAVGGVLLARQRTEIDALKNAGAEMSSALDALPFDLWILDAAGHIRLLNETARRNGSGLKSDCHAEREAANRRALAGETLSGEISWDVGGQRHHGHRVILPLRQDGRIVGAIGAQLDITPRVEADETRRKSEEKLALHVRHTPLAVIEWNLAFRVTAWNPAAERLFGYTAAEATGRHAVGFIVPDSARSQMNRVWAALLAHKGGTRSTNENITKDGRTIHCEWYNTPLVDDTGAVIGVATSVQDETERGILQRQLQQAQKMESIGQLAGGVAHEFNNLLTPMLMQTDLIVQRYASDARLMELVKPVQTAIHQAAELNRRILAIGRRSPEQRELLLLNPLVENALTLLRPSLDRRIEFTISLATGLEPLLLDRVYVTQIVMNLALNARDTLLEKLGRDPPPGWVPRLSISTSRVKDAVRREATSAMPFALAVQRLTVTDNGAGIAPDVRARIFEPFSTTKPAGSGTGLGLAVVWNDVHSLGGWIEVDNGPGGEGTRFQVSIPVAADADTAPAPVVLQVVPAPEGAPGPTKIGQRSAHPLKILLAEDNALVAETFAAVLGASGHDVLVAQDGEEAWELFNRRGAGFDAVLADFNMPRINGGDLLRRVKGSGFKGRVLIVSGYLTSEKVDELIELGADGVLRKPFSPAELFAMLEDQR